MYDAPNVRTRATYDFDEQRKVEQIMLGFSQARTRRYNFETQWQEAALLCWPEYANTFYYGYDQMPGQKKTQQQLDTRASIASHRFAAIADSLVTPMALCWSTLRASDDYLMKQRGVKQYYNELTRAVWRARYDPLANFLGQQLQNWQSVGVFGNQYMYVDELDGTSMGGARGLRYKSIPVGQVYLVENWQGAVDSFYRTIRMTARQIYQQWPDSFPEALRAPLEQQSATLFWVVQYVCPRDDWQPWRVDKKGKRFASYYVSVEGHCILEEGGYRCMPLAAGRYMQAPDEWYGRGPAQMVLPTLKTLNAEKGVFLKQGHRAGDPVYLTADDGLVDPQFHPGAINKGGMTMDGKPLIGILPTGSIQITKEMMDEERETIDDAFLVTLFRLALKSEDTPQMAARQVLEMIQQQGMLLAPTLGRQLCEYLGPNVYRELDVMAYQGLLPPKPDVVKEAAGEYTVKWTNPLMRAIMASEDAGFMQMVEMTGTVAQTSGDSTVWDIFDFDTAMPEMAENRGVPVRWLANSQQLAQKRQARAKAAQQEAQTKQMPAQAAIIKARAIQAKAATGGNIGGTLSGVPATQMPGIPGNPAGMPGNPAGMPGQPGIGGRPGLPGQPG